jgi:pyridoxal phosphate enzyme (YggS family)
MTIGNKIKELHNSIPQSATLVAVSKFHPAEAVMAAYDAGQRVFGESRVQELLLKHEALPKDIEWHMIGHLQTNKVRQIVPFVSLIQSVDSVRLVECINREAERIGRVVDILLEIHVAEEETKTGWNFDELVTFLQGGGMETLKNVRVRGIMGMATNTDDEMVIRADFERLAECKELISKYFGEDFDTLSMGMSDDYELAIECGSTMVRIGSSIFGERY